MPCKCGGCSGREGKSIEQIYQKKTQSVAQIPISLQPFFSVFHCSSTSFYLLGLFVVLASLAFVAEGLIPQFGKPVWLKLLQSYNKRCVKKNTKTYMLLETHPNKFLNMITDPVSKTQSCPSVATFPCNGSADMKPFFDAKLGSKMKLSPYSGRFSHRLNGC